MSVKEHKIAKALFKHEFAVLTLLVFAAEGDTGYGAGVVLRECSHKWNLRKKDYYPQ